MDIIFKEYCLELFVENGSEWFASLRFEKDGNPWFKTLKPDVSDVSTNKYCWPIPARGNQREQSNKTQSRFR